MAVPSTSRPLTELDQIQILNEVLEDESISEYSSDDDSVFDIDYTQFVTPGTVVFSDSDCDNGRRGQQDDIVRAGVVSNK
jgi:hypothetical protein